MLVTQRATSSGHLKRRSRGGVTRGNVRNTAPSRCSGPCRRRRSYSTGKCVRGPVQCCRVVTISNELLARRGRHPRHKQTASNGRGTLPRARPHRRATSDATIRPPSRAETKTRAASSHLVPTPAEGATRRARELRCFRALFFLLQGRATAVQRTPSS